MNINSMLLRTAWDARNTTERSPHSFPRSRLSWKVQHLPKHALPCFPVQKFFEIYSRSRKDYKFTLEVGGIKNFPAGLFWTPCGGQLTV